MKASALPVAVVSLTFVLSTACERQPDQPTAAETRAGLAALRARSGSSLPARAVHIRAAEGALVPNLAGASEVVTARVVLPGRANGQIHIEDRATGTSIDIALVGAKNSVGQVVDGYVVYPKGHAWGSIYQRAEPSGVEDYLAFDGRPVSPSIAYDVALGPKVAGLRLVGNQLEMLDGGGVPRLRVAPPYVVGADGALTDALLAVEGCAVDTDPAGPWGRTVTPPGARRCRVRVSWADEAVVYPALLDPRWQTTGSLSVARQDHNLIYLPLTGKVLAVGGRSSPTSTTGLASAELFDKNTGTWSATSSMSGGRWSASATLLGSSSNGTTSQKVLIAGGINGTASVNTARLYNQTAGTWAAAGTLNAPRHLHTATRLNDGRVLVCGGMNGSTVLTSAALYNPASGSGSWAATTGPIPPPGWRSGTATLIQTSNGQLNNKVLLAGGNNGTSTISAVFLFDPAQSAFSTLASMPSPREGHQAVALSDGRILFSGGKNGSTYLASSVIFDPSWGPGNWTTAGNMTSPRWGHAMNLLPTAVLHLGLVLVSGGSNGTSTLSSTEYWNGTNWATDGAMVAPVQWHGSVVLGNSILIAGGAINNGSTTVSAAEIYDPSIALGCTSGSQCASGFCVSGVCCDSACNGGCGSCNLAGHLGVCTPLTSGTVCRALTGICDAAETCNGSSLACPADSYQPPTTVCRPSAGVCDVAETCTGASAACPLDVFQPATTVCRASADICDVAESCTGTSAACPADAFLPPTTVCRASAGACDVAETCTGTAAACPADVFATPSTICRLSAGACDVPETCTGTSAICPVDGFVQASMECRPAILPCDAPEICPGDSPDCPADAFRSAGTVCRVSTGACDPAETCSGSGPDCPDDLITSPPNEPTGLSTTTTPSSVVLSWAASPGATSYHVKRSTASGGPYTTIASPTSPTYTDPGLASGLTFYYAVTAVNACGESGYQGLAYTPHLPHALPSPPTQTGCFVWTLNGWFPTPCADEQWISLHTQRPEISRGGVHTFPPAGGSDVSLVYGQIETTLIDPGPAFNHCTDPDPTHCNTSPTMPDVITRNAWSFQVNTQGFPCASSPAQTCVVQFVMQHFPNTNPASNGGMAICMWYVNASIPDYPTHCVPGDQAARPGDFVNFDYVNLAGYTLTDNSTTPPTPKLGLVVQYSMVPENPPMDPNALNQVPGLYAVTFEDTIGLTGNWHDVTGGIMGAGWSSELRFDYAELLNVIAASDCPGDTTASGPTCPSQPELSTSNTRYITASAGGNTAESDNLTLGQAILTYPNRNLMVTEEFASTNVPVGSSAATCLPGEGDHVFIKDSLGDNGGIPSNSGNVSFWGSPDIFLLPAGAQAPGISDVAANFVVTPGQPYELYLRLNNDAGCTDVSDIKVLIDADAFLEMGLAQWMAVTPGADSGQYLSTPGTVPRFSRTIVGPFSWTPPAGTPPGDRCLLAAIAAGNQTTPAFPLDPAYKSNQIAQRNLHVTGGSTCDYTISGYYGANSANLLIGVSVFPAASIPGTTGVSLTFDDNASSDWYNAWHAQQNRLPAGTLDVTQQPGNKTVVTLGTSNIALDTVALAPSSSPHVNVTITSSPVSPVPSVAISTLLTDPQTGSIVVQNGGSCQYHAAPVVATVPCPAGQSLCSGSCVDLSSDPSNCGACGNQCAPGTSCAQGVCGQIVP